MTEPQEPPVDDPPRRPPAAARGALTPAHWIDAATAVLVDRGIDHVRVDVLAGELGVTRGSFYWHFRDREELLRRVLQAWRERATEQLTARLARAHDDAAEQLRDVLSLPLRGRAARRAARIELALRAWARRDAMARQAVDEADAARIAYIADILARLLDMQPLLDRRTDGFSQGERMKTALARALVHDPANIVLDEPTNGLDVVATRALRETLRRLRDEHGKCIVFSTHIMQEVERLCDHVVVVSQGRTVASGTVQELSARTGQADFEETFVQLAFADRKTADGAGS